MFDEDTQQFFDDLLTIVKVAAERCEDDNNNELVTQFTELENEISSDFPTLLKALQVLRAEDRTKIKTEQDDGRVYRGDLRQVDLRIYFDTSDGFLTAPFKIASLDDEVL